MSINLDYILPIKSLEMKKCADNFKKLDLNTFINIKNATVLPVVNFHDSDVSHGRGGVVDSDGKYVEASKTKARVVGAYEFKESECEYINEKVVFCGFFHRAWGHFLTEVVSRLWYSLEHDNTVEKYVFIIEKGQNFEIKNNYLEFLKLLNIENKVFLINHPTKFKEVVIPEAGFVYNEYFTVEFQKMYQHIINKALERYKGSTYDKVYFSKSMLCSNVISNLNYKLLDKYFKKNGFKTFYPEQLNLIDMIGIIQGCSQFAGISSSLAHNMLFGNSNQTVIAIEKQAFYNPYQIFVAKIVDHNAIFIDASRTITPVGSFGPFIFDFTESFKNYTKDFNLKPVRPLSNLKYKRILKKFKIYYFNNCLTLPPDYMYQSYIMSMEREAYEDTVKNGQIFKMSLFQRVILKLEFIIINFKNKLYRRR